MSTSTILEDISQALENWSHRILDVETKVKRVKDFRETIVADLHRKIEDGVISLVPFTHSSSKRWRASLGVNFLD